MDSLKDVLFALRSLRRTPGSTAIVVLTLALGIGATTAIFSVVHAVVLRPLPYPDGDRLGVVRFDGQGIHDMAVTPSNVLDFEEQSRTLDELALFGAFEATLTLEDGAMEYVPTAFVTPNLPRLLGITPRAGRPLDPLVDVRDGGLGNVLMSEELWRRSFGADAGIVGREIVVNDQRLLVAGIVPRGARLLVGGRERVDLWSARPPVRERGNVFSRPVLVRLAPGVTFDEASAELDAIAERNRLRDFQGEDGRGTYSVVPLHENLVGEVRPALLVLLGAVGFVLLLACANVANLLLVRARSRRQEWAVRMALGAGRGRLVRLGLTESLVLAVLGGVLGVVVAGWAARLLPLLAPDDLPRAVDIGLDAQVLAFAAGLSVLTAVLFGLMPAWRSSSVRVHDTLKEGGRAGGPGRGRLSRVLVAGELAVALMLVVGAGLMLRTFVNLHRVDLGFEPEGLLAFQVPLSFELWRSEQGRLDFGRRVVERLEALPGVESASLTNIVPLSGGYNTASWAYDDASAASFGELTGLFRRSWPGYFETLGIPILEGRDFEPDDTANDRYVLIVSEAMADRAWPRESPIGKRVMIDFRTPSGMTELRWTEVVGLVPSTRERTLHGDEPPQAYLPYWSTRFGNNVMLRAAGDPAALAPAIREAVAELGAGRPIRNLRTMESYVAEATRETRFVLSTIGAFSGFAVFLAALGVYGVMSQLVSRRRHEIGLRMALGARRRDVLWRVLGQGLGLALAGLVAGLAGALALTRVLEGFLFGVTTSDPATFAAVAAFLLFAAVAACLLPAARASRVEPATALRYE